MLVNNHNNNHIINMEKKQQERLSLLRKTQELIKVERALTATLEKVEPWLISNTISKNISKVQKRVRPIPTTMDEVNQILAVGRNYASRTSAPAGWNPNAPVVGFSTPNPLPHMLRGGALAALQLEGAKQAESDKKRKREEEEMEKATAAKKQQQEEATTSSSQQAQEALLAKKGGEQAQLSRRDDSRRWRPQPKKEITSMNLSDSSSSSEEEESDDD